MLKVLDNDNNMLLKIGVKSKQNNKLKKYFQKFVTLIFI